MPRKPFEITPESAVSIAKWRLGEIAEDPNTPWLERVGINAAINNGYVERIMGELQALGLHISADENDPRHQEWLKHRAIIRKEK